MGLTYVKLTVKRNKGAKGQAVLEFLVDSGAYMTVAPARVLRKLGIEPDEEHSFFLANGEEIKRKVGEAYFIYGDHKATAKVIFGEEGDSNLMGVLTLEALGFALDPLKRELKPVRMVLM
jgi:predicted aspartyl protease